MGLGEYGICLDLSRTHQGKDSILVVVDIFMKMAHFIPCCKNTDATHVAHFFSNEIIRLHGLLKNIISDMDAKLIGNFWRTLWKNIRAKLNFNST